MRFTPKQPFDRYIHEGCAADLQEPLLVQSGEYLRRVARGEGPEATAAGRLLATLRGAVA